MDQQPIEMILARQFADHLATPVILLDHEGSAIFWNEPAEEFSGLRYDEHGRMPRELWMRSYHGRTREGAEIPREELPVMVALDRQRPAHSAHQVRFFGERWFELAVSALPVIGQQDRFLGVLVLFWSSG